MTLVLGRADAQEHVLLVISWRRSRYLPAILGGLLHLLGLVLGLSGCESSSSLLLGELAALAHVLTSDAGGGDVPVVGVAELNLPFSLYHLVDVALELVWDLDAEDEGSVPVLNGRVLFRIGVDIRVVVVGGAPQSVEGHADELFLQEVHEEELKGLSHTDLWHRDLPQVALDQVGVSLHHVPQLLVVLLGCSLEDLLEDGDDMWVEVRLASERVYDSRDVDLSGSIEGT